MFSLPGCQGYKMRNSEVYNLTVQGKSDRWKVPEYAECLNVHRKETTAKRKDLIMSPEESACKLYINKEIRISQKKVRSRKVVPGGRNSNHYCQSNPHFILRPHSTHICCTTLV